MLNLQPISFGEACEFVDRHHRHHIAPVGHKLCVAVNDGEKVVGVLIAGRPVSRRLDDGYTLEVTRVCTTGEKNAPSMLYAAASRAARALGYRRVITYILATEPGTSLRAAGWKELYRTDGRSWNVPTRPRVDKHPLGQKVLWEMTA